MLDSANVPVYIKSVTFKKIKVGSEKHKGTLMVGQFELNPKLAAELGLKERLYRRNDGEADPDVSGIDFTMKPSKAQRIEMRVDPFMDPSLILPDVRIKRDIVIRRPSDGSHMVVTFRAEFMDIDGADYLSLKDAFCEQRFMTFSNAQAGLFDEADAAERRNSKNAKPAKASRRRDEAPAGDSAPATH